MRIASLACTPYTLPFRRTLVTARESLAERRGWLLRLTPEPDPGAEQPAPGMGEAAPLPHFGGESFQQAQQTLEAWEKELPGRTVDLPGRRAPETPPAFGLVDGTLGLVNPAFLSFAAPTALHGLETALLDLAARRHGLSLASWLHPSAPEQVAVNATLGAADLETTLAAARDAVALGYRTLKVKVGADSPEQDEQRLRRLRETLGPTVRLRADANGAWDEATAMKLLARWADLDLEYVEQPVAPENLAAMARLAAAHREGRGAPIAADEALRGPEDARRLLDARAAQVLVLKPMLLGGPMAALAIAEQAHARGVPVVITTSLEGVFGRLAALHTAAAVDALHLAAGLPAPPPAHGLATGGLLERDHLPAPLPAEGPRMEVPVIPGLGVEGV